MQGVEIRRAGPESADEIVAGNLAMARETEGRVLDVDVLRSGVRAVLDDPQRGTYYVARFQGRTVGQLLITREWSDWRNAWFWWIQSVYVVPEFRGRGVYRALHRHIQALARREPDVCGLRLYVERDNRTAQQVYERLGMLRTAYHMYEQDWSAGTAGT